MFAFGLPLTSHYKRIWYVMLCCQIDQSISYFLQRPKDYSRSTSRSTNVLTVERSLKAKGLRVMPVYTPTRLYGPILHTL